MITSPTFWAGSLHHHFHDFLDCLLSLCHSSELEYVCSDFPAKRLVLTTLAVWPWISPFSSLNLSPSSEMREVGEEVFQVPSSSCIWGCKTPVCSLMDWNVSLSPDHKRASFPPTPPCKGMNVEGRKSSQCFPVTQLLALGHCDSELRQSYEQAHDQV